MKSWMFTWILALIFVAGCHCRFDDDGRQEISIRNDYLQLGYLWWWPDDKSETQEKTVCNVRIGFPVWSDMANDSRVYGILFSPLFDFGETETDGLATSLVLGVEKLNGLATALALGIGKLNGFATALAFMGNEISGFVVAPAYFIGELNGVAIAPVLALNVDMNGVAIAPFNYHEVAGGGGVVVGIINMHGAPLGIAHGDPDVALRSRVWYQLGIANFDNSNGSHLQFGVYNHSNKFSTVQIGLINRSNPYDCKDQRFSLQIGLWNDNGKRSLPLVNFTL